MCELNEFSMAISECDGGLKKAYDVAKSTLWVMQSDSYSLANQGTKSGFEIVGHGLTIILHGKYRLRRGDAITI